MAAGRNNRSKLLLVLLLVTSLFLITLDLRGISIARSSRSATQSFLAPVQRGFSDFFSPVGNFFSDVKNFGKSKAQITDLEAENAKLKSKLVLNSDIEGQLTKLKGVLNLAGRGGYKVVSARVIGRGSASTFSQTITIDAGSSDGIQKDMTVISESGIVGVVKSVTGSSSIVILMSDPTFRISVRIAGTQTIGILLGKGNNRYTLQLLDPTGTIKFGDVLLSLGSDNNRPFVPGLPVGSVSFVDHSSSALSQSASVTGYSNLASLGVVSVITATAKQDPRDSLVPVPVPVPVPDPVKTIYITQTPAPFTSSAPSGAPTVAISPTPKATSVTKDKK